MKSIIYEKHVKKKKKEKLEKLANDAKCFDEKIYFFIQQMTCSNVRTRISTKL